MTTDTSGHELALAQAAAMIERQANEIARLRDELTTARKTNYEWLAANGPGGWINDLRDENEALASNLRGKHATTGATYAHLIAERDSLRYENARLRALICDARQEIVSPACNHDTGMQMLDLIERIDNAMQKGE